MRNFILALFISIFLVNAEHYYEKGKRVDLVKIGQTRSNKGEGITKYRTSTGRIFKLQNKIIVKVKNHENIQTIVDKYNVEVVDSSTSGFALLSVKEGDDLFLITRKLNDESFVEIAHPDFARERRVR